jgi:hypothetical protein
MSRDRVFLPYYKPMRSWNQDRYHTHSLPFIPTRTHTMNNNDTNNSLSENYSRSPSPPPSKSASESITHMEPTQTSGLSQNRGARSAKFQEQLDRLRLPIHPLYPLPLGTAHPSFPKTMLEFHLLSEEDLDSIASYYHQTSRTHPYRTAYPACMNWDAEFLARPTDVEGLAREEVELYPRKEERVEMKRRMLGKFVGFAGCETPVKEAERRVKFYEDRIRLAVRRRERLREQTERKNPWFRGAW